MKIKASDLRIGNFVHANTPYMIVKSITEHEIELYMPLSEADNFTYSIEEIEPIELSSDILLKAGFISDDNIVYELNGVQFGAIENGFLFLQEFRSSQFFVYQYLHQVQNLYFALTGTELHINI